MFKKIKVKWKLFILSIALKVAINNVRKEGRRLKNIFNTPAYFLRTIQWEQEQINLILKEYWKQRELIEGMSQSKETIVHEQQ